MFQIKSTKISSFLRLSAFIAWLCVFLQAGSVESSYFPTVGSNIGIGTSTPVGGMVIMNGNVGIGTWSPTQRLQVVGTVSATAFVGDGSGLTGIAASGWSDGGTNVYSSTTTDNVGIGTTTPTAVLLVENAGAQNSFRVNDAVLDASPFIIDAGGNVGIGTITLSEKLIVSGNALVTGVIKGGTSASLNLNGYVNNGIDALFLAGGMFRTTETNIQGTNDIFFQAIPPTNAGYGYLETWSGAGMIVGTGGNTSPVIFQVNRVEKMRVDSNGNVGIGTSVPVGGFIVMNGNAGIGTWKPSAKLQVVGSVVATSFVGDGSGLTGILASGWTDGGTNVYTSTTTDTVGIGTTTASTTLEIVKQGTSAPLMVSGSATGDGNFLIIASGGNVGVGTISPRSVLAVMNGNVGIGTTNAAAALAVGGASEFQVNTAGAIAASTGFTTSGGYAQSGTGANTLTGTTTFSNATTAAVFSTGNVGMGTSSASVALLNVNGETYIAGPVGIGTFTPTGMMDIRQDEVRIWTGAGTNTNATAAGELYVEGDLEVDGTIYGDGLGITALPTTLAAGGWVDGGANVYSSTTTDLVAIGTTTPVSKLTVKGNVGIGTTTPYSTIAAPANGMAVEGNVGIGTWAANNAKLVVMGGNVGIGTTIPIERLQVSGNIGLSVANSKITGPTGVTIEQTGDDYGTTRLHIQNRSGVNGAMFEQAGSVDLVDFVFKGLSNQRNIRYENRGGSFNFAGTPEFQFGTAGSPEFAVSDSASYFKTRVGIGTTMTVGGLAVMNGNVGIGTWSPRASLQVNNAINFTSEYDNGNSGASPTVNWTLGNKQKITLNNNATFAFTAPGGVSNLLLRIVQDGTGSRTAAWPASVKWPSGSPPTLSTAAAAEDVITCYYQGTNYYCTATFNFL